MVQLQILSDSIPNLLAKEQEKGIEKKRGLFGSGKTIVCLTFFYIYTITVPILGDD